MIFAGLHVGSILGLLVAPWLIHNLGWPSVFYAFGAAGLAWALWFNSLCGSWSWRDPQFMEALAPGEAAKHLQQRQPPTSGAGTPALAAVTTASTASVEVHQPEHSSSDAEAHGGGDHGGHGVLIDANMAIPYRAFIRSRPVQALGELAGGAINMFTSCCMTAIAA
jgi:ACS family sodium-dependent inorganic phosphate cotransporter